MPQGLSADASRKGSESVTDQEGRSSDLSAVPKDLFVGASNDEFSELLTMIEQARVRAARAINLELINLYWNVGAYVSERTRTEGWGNAVIARFSESVRSAIKIFACQI